MTQDDKENVAAIIGMVLAASTLGVFIVLAGGFAVATSWNLFAPAMFDAPAAQWKNGIGLVGFLWCLRACIGDSFSVKSRR